MEERAGWTDYQNRICYPVERYLFGCAVRDRERLISAIISNAFLNEKIGCEQLRNMFAGQSLETIGDFVLDFVIIDKTVSMYNTSFSGARTSGKEQSGTCRGPGSWQTVSRCWLP